MGFLETHLLTAIVFLPLLGAFICLAFPKGEDSGVRGFALTVTLLDLGLAQSKKAYPAPENPADGIFAPIPRAF